MLIVKIVVKVTALVFDFARRWAASCDGGTHQRQISEAPFVAERPTNFEEPTQGSPQRLVQRYIDRKFGIATG